VWTTKIFRFRFLVGRLKFRFGPEPFTAVYLTSTQTDKGPRTIPLATSGGHAAFDKLPCIGGQCNRLGPGGQDSMIDTGRCWQNAPTITI
jgi:hypothetical protein